MSGRVLFSAMRKQVDAQIASGETVWCFRCNQQIEIGESWDIDHKVPVTVDPSLEFEADNLAPAHSKCNRRHGQKLSMQKQAGAANWKGSSHKKMPAALRRLAEAKAQMGGTEGPLPREWPVTLSQNPRHPGAFDRPPMRFSAPHPDAVGTLIDEWVDDIERLMRRKLRYWQWLVYARALEVDAAGRLVWMRLLCSTPRQQGKSIIVDGLSQIRCEKAEYFGEPQSALFVSKDVRLARALMSRHWPHYTRMKDLGFTVRKSFGAESITWPDESAWQVISQTGVYGWTASQAMLDEAWSADPAVVSSALGPTMAERIQPQLWLLSTANLNCTELVPSFMKDKNVCVMIWGAFPEENPKDPEVWEAASAFWTPQRKTLIEFDMHKADLVTEWLNRWPVREEEQGEEAPWVDPAAWGEVCSIDNDAPGAASLILGGIEVSLDGLTFSASRAWRAADGRLVFTGKTGFKSLGGALASIQGGWDHLIAGLSIKKLLPADAQAIGQGASETRHATGLLARLIEERTLVVDPASPVVDQFDHTAVDIRETGPYINSSKSGGDVSLMKLLAWSVMQFESEESPVNAGAAEIW